MIKNTIKSQHQQQNQKQHSIQQYLVHINQQKKGIRNPH